ncbi:type II toxin-antitoxin system RelE/ParE family toxin [Paludisphaera rhizosphaerae]|uniref:type II toxin-antitoxin system RelE/ParE family toxin n=1 Tax=Paludisphaera rhizosphaerae TaxID=2711216 RepID=UPI0013E9D7F3
MTRFRLSPQAERDIEAILGWSHEQFGERVRLRYEELLTQSILDLVEDPRRVGVQERPELANGAFTYHLRHSRDHVSRSIGRIRKPRHFLLYRVAHDGCLEIARVLHDSMDLARHFPPDDRLEDDERG